MQTILSLQSAEGGIISLNGRMAGELDREHPLYLPVCPTGVLLLQMYPFARDLLPLALRLTLSKGVPLLNNPPDDRFCAALWYGGILEIELLPQRQYTAAETFLFEQDSIRFFLREHPETLICETPDGTFIHPLPDGAQPPALTPMNGAFMFSGKCAEDEYVLMLSGDARQVQLSLTGRSISLPEKDILQLLHPTGDLMGHAQLEAWQRTSQGWVLSRSEPVWLNGAPYQPQTPEEIAIAAVEAAQDGRMHEAQSFLAPMCMDGNVLEQVRAYDGCTAMRYPIPGGERAIGLMKLDGALLRITPLIYQTSGSGRLEKLKIVEKSIK